jgi:hypothetical protein
LWTNILQIDQDAPVVLSLGVKSQEVDIDADQMVRLRGDLKKVLPASEEDSGVG